MNCLRFIGSFPTRLSDRGKAVLLLTCVCLGATLIFRFDPVAFAAFPRCPFWTITGFFCPGCGSVRSLHCLLHGHLPKAFGLNPLSTLLLPFLAYVFLSRISVAFLGKPFPRPFISGGWSRTLFWAIIAFWVLRNVPVHPFSYLAP